MLRKYSQIQVAQTLISKLILQSRWVAKSVVLFTQSSRNLGSFYLAPHPLLFLRS